MSATIKRMLMERQAVARAPLAADAAKRRAEVKAAFLEGHCFGVDFMDPDEAWEMSKARRALYQGPSTPLHLRRPPRDRSVAP